MGWIAGIAVLIVLVSLVYWYEARALREAIHRIQGKYVAQQAISAAECANLTGEQVPPEVAMRVRRVLASFSEANCLPRVMVVEPDRLLPDDSLVGDLAYDVDSLAFCEMMARLENEFGTGLTVRDLDNMRTVGDVIRRVAAEVRARR